MSKPQVIGVISDTHGLLRPEAVEGLQGSELIIHAGDIGNPEILDELRKIAPVEAIRGNVDGGIWAQGLPQTRTVEIGEVRIYVIHNINDLSIDAAAAGYTAVVSGHSHRPSVVQKNGVLFLNPGSAGPRRFNCMRLTSTPSFGRQVVKQWRHGFLKNWIGSPPQDGPH